MYVSAAVYCSSSSSESSPATCRRKKRGERGAEIWEGSEGEKEKGQKKGGWKRRGGGGRERVGVKNLVEEVVHNDNYLLQSLTIKPH